MLIEHQKSDTLKDSASKYHVPRGAGSNRNLELFGNLIPAMSTVRSSTSYSLSQTHRTIVVRRRIEIALKQPSARHRPVRAVAARQHVIATGCCDRRAPCRRIAVGD